VLSFTLEVAVDLPTSEVEADVWPL